jgi:hypothetical protein
MTNFPMPGAWDSRGPATLSVRTIGKVLSVPLPGLGKWLAANPSRLAVVRQRYGFFQTR